MLLLGVYNVVQYTPDERESLSTGEIHFTLHYIHLLSSLKNLPTTQNQIWIINYDVFSVIH